MLLRQGSARDDDRDRNLACALAAVAGALNAAAFSDVGFFSANMTGNVSALSDHLALGHWAQAGFYLTIVIAFVTGAMASTILINAGHRQGLKAIYAINILIEALLLVLVGAFDLWLAAPWRLAVVVLGLSFLMGLQNAVVTRISDARVRTTHVSGMATDIGIELGMLLDIVRRAHDPETAPAIISRLRLHGETILSFLIGGVVGVLIYHKAGGYLLWIASAGLAIIAIPPIVFSRRRETINPPIWPDMPNDL